MIIFKKQQLKYTEIQDRRWLENTYEWLKQRIVGKSSNICVTNEFVWDHVSVLRVTERISCTGKEMIMVTPKTFSNMKSLRFKKMHMNIYRDI